jgi:DNA modification methylase
VDCCITSPPYYMQRDYGTGEWKGGNKECRHEAASIRIREKCKCGAIRVKDLQIGQERTPEEYIERLKEVFREVKRVLKETGTLFVVIGDTYNGSTRNGGRERVTGIEKARKGKLGAGLRLKNISEKSLIGIPYRFVLMMIEEGWILRNSIIWVKTNAMPESVKDRYVRAHEHVFFFSKKKRYYFNHEQAKEPALSYRGAEEARQEAGVLFKNEEDKLYVEKEEDRRGLQRGYKGKEGRTGLSEQYHGKMIRTYEKRNKRDVWEVGTVCAVMEHYAVYPEKLILPMVLSCCCEGGIILDPFMGSGTTGVVAVKNNRGYIGCELEKRYVKMAEERIKAELGLF